MPEILDIHAFLRRGELLPVIDVRSPAEFAKGHIPGASNLPLFSNEERALVGTMYKQCGRESAVLEGLHLVGPKMRELVEQINTIFRNHRQSTAANNEDSSGKEKNILIYCWRGGMRSQSVGWLLEQMDFAAFTLQGGYKSYRHFALETFEQKKRIRILGGKTGSGKTLILRELEKLGEQVIDLEALAHHKGSAFGAFGEQPRPTQQQFENALAPAWRGLPPDRPVWLEDEALFIGRCMIPKSIFEQMKEAETYFVEMPLPLRVQHLVEGYSKFDKQDLIDAINNIRKRLGGLNADNAIRALENGDFARCGEILLQGYYDKAYLHALSRRDSEKIITVKTATSRPSENARKVIEAVKSDLVKSN